MTTRPRVALFIDAENASARYVADYLERCGELGKLTIARCYGGTAGLKKWDKAMKDHHIVPMQTPPGASKENASDFALTIDAVSLLHRGLFDHAVIASSDADFMQLAIHIREQGKGIDGLGESKATKPLQSAFDKFTIIPAAAPKRGSCPETIACARTRKETRRASGHRYGDADGHLPETQRQRQGGNATGLRNGTLRKNAELQERPPHPREFPPQLRRLQNRKRRDTAAGLGSPQVNSSSRRKSGPRITALLFTMFDDGATFPGSRLPRDDEKGKRLREGKNPTVYILASRKNGTLYIGVTSDLCNRISQHKEGKFPVSARSII